MASATRAARVAAVGLVGALALTACGGGGGSDDDSSARPSASATSTATADTGGGSGTGGTGATSAQEKLLEGSWLATTDGKVVALVITGTQAGLFSTGGSVCSGSVATSGDSSRISLTCGDGNTDRAEGTVASVDSSTLRVTWTSKLGDEDYTKSEGGKLPSGLATASLGS